MNAQIFNQLDSCDDGLILAALPRLLSLEMSGESLRPYWAAIIKLLPVTKDFRVRAFVYRTIQQIRSEDDENMQILIENSCSRESSCGEVERNLLAGLNGAIGSVESLTAMRYVRARTSADFSNYICDQNPLVAFASAANIVNNEDAVSDEVVSHAVKFIDSIDSISEYPPWDQAQFFQGAEILRNTIVKYKVVKFAYEAMQSANCEVVLQAVTLLLRLNASGALALGEEFPWAFEDQLFDKAACALLRVIRIDPVSVLSLAFLYLIDYQNSKQLIREAFGFITSSDRSIVEASLRYLIAVAPEEVKLRALQDVITFTAIDDLRDICAIILTSMVAPRRVVSLILFLGRSKISSAVMHAAIASLINQLEDEHIAAVVAAEFGPELQTFIYSLLIQKPDKGGKMLQEQLSKFLGKSTDCSALVEKLPLLVALSDNSELLLACNCEYVKQFGSLPSEMREIAKSLYFPAAVSSNTDLSVLYTVPNRPLRNGIENRIVITEPVYTREAIDGAPITKVTLEDQFINFLESA